MKKSHLKKLARRKAARTGFKTTAPQLYQAVKAVALKQAYKAQETKYVADRAIIQQNIFSTLTSAITLNPPAVSGGLWCALPPLSAGFNGAQIIGDTCQMVSGALKVHISFKEEAISTKDIIVKMFCLYPKSVSRILPDSQSAPPGALLRTGDNNPATQATDWNVAAINPIHLGQMRINNLQFIGFVKTFNMMKNYGRSNDAAGQSDPNVPYHMSREFTWTFGKHKKLKYDIGVNSTNTYPSNFLPLCGLVAYYADGSEGASENVKFTATREIYYKDA